MSVIVSDSDYWLTIRGQLTSRYLGDNADLVAFQFTVLEIDKRPKRLSMVYEEYGSLLSSTVSFQNNQYLKIDIPENTTWFLPRRS